MSHVQFDQRLRRLSRKHRAMSRGYTTRMRPDGLIETKPRRSRPGISAKSVILFLGAFFLFKGFLIASIGAEGYDERVARLAAGTLPEQAGGFVMQADPLAEMISLKIGPVLR